MIFEHDRDYLAFENVLGEVQERLPMRILAWCLMPNHWHLLLWPRHDMDLSSYVGRVSLVHAQRWHAHRASAGTGHLYQGRFKSFVVQDDAYFLAACRYVEANALRAGLVSRAEDWRWGSLWRRSQRGGTAPPPLVHEWPVPRPNEWLSYVNELAKPAEVDELRRCARRNCPYGSEHWVRNVAEKLGLQSTLRVRGRPKKGS
jgi:putative transposase